MRRLDSSFSRSFALILLASSSGCIGVSQPRNPSGGNDSAPVSAETASKMGLRTCPNGMKPADDGLADDFEDGNTQLLVLAGRDGYWWKHADPNGSKFDPDELLLKDVAGDGSNHALFASGTTAASDEAYGASIGVNFSSAGLYDASYYDGISFRAKVDSDAAKKVRLKVGDVNTHQDAGVCKTCWNHFGKDLVLTDDWKEYQVSFTELRQAPGWGDPNPPAITSEKLYSLDFTFEKSGKFAFWLDDVQFLVCK